MKIFKKTKIRLNGKKIVKLYLLGLPFYSKEQTYSKKVINILCLSFSYHHNKFDRNEKLIEPVCNFIDHYNSALKPKKIKTLLWVDQSLGGGTEVYSQTQFSLLNESYSILRIQYDHNYDCFLLSVPNKIASYICTAEELFFLLKDIHFSEICVNSLVGWKNSCEVLGFISDYKKRYCTRVSFRCHDFQAICPSFNLLNCDGEFCNLKYEEGCDTCINRVKFCDNEYHNRVLFSGFYDFSVWRNSWGLFFSEVVDEVIAFSDSTKELFVRGYPQLSDLVKVIPHKFTSLKKAIIKPHKGINIALLGNMNLYQKGNLIIKRMIEANTDPEVRFFIIGSFDGEYNDLVVTGEYKTQDISDLLTKYNIDIVFIPSIWPETFSYTTSEAISTDIPVACYNLGASAERVSRYEKGLVLKEINPINNLLEIKSFVKKIRNA